MNYLFNVVCIITVRFLKEYVYTLKSSKYRVTGRAVEFECKKAGSGEVWPRLSEHPQKLPWLKIDFDRFAFDESEASSEEDLSVSSLVDIKAVDFVIGTCKASIFDSNMNQCIFEYVPYI